MSFSFLCNICSNENSVESIKHIDQELSVCPHCGSNVRFRWIIHSLSTSFFGESLCLNDFPVSKHIKGIGMSDEPVFANLLSEKLDYTNTFYHREPQFDIKDSRYGEASSLDFIIASEVFEHVAPPVQPAFDNLRRLIKADGLIFFTTPWRPIGFTVEHFPDLFDWTVTTFRDKHVLINKTAAEEVQAFTNLSFHGGAGETLEMRLFAHSSLIQNFEAAGLIPRFTADPIPKFGIVYNLPWSLPCIVQRVSGNNGSSPAQAVVAESEVQRLRRELAVVYEELNSQTSWVQVITEQQRETERRVQELSRERSLVQRSRWLRLGNRFGLGPKLK